MTLGFKEGQAKKFARTYQYERKYLIYLYLLQYFYIVMATQIDSQFLAKLKKDIRIINNVMNEWTKEDVLRFLDILKIETALRDIIINKQINGEKLFDLKYVEFYFEAVLSDKNYMPMHKLLFCIRALISDIKLRRSILQNEEIKQQKEDDKQAMYFQKTIQISGRLIKAAKQQLKQMGDIPIIDISSSQLIKFLKKINLERQAQIVKQFNVDAFSLIFILSDNKNIKTIGNYFQEQIIQSLMMLSDLFMHIYFYQQSKNKKQNKNDMFIDDEMQFQDIKLPEQDGVRNSYGYSEYGVSQRGSVARQSLLGVSERGSVVRQSMYGVSERGSYLAQSMYGNSERGSVMGSVRGSVYAESQIIDDDESTKNSYAGTNMIMGPEIRVSSIQDLLTFSKLLKSSMKLPFNLLSLQPIQQIKIASTPYPFNVEKGIKRNLSVSSNQSGQSNVTSTITLDESKKKEEIIEDQFYSETKTFNLSGARFGRSSDNDYSFPDQLTISGRHAQVIFKNENYYIRDLGSKTGTFILVNNNSPLILKNDLYIQLSYEVQLKVKIIKNEQSEGIIKLEFKKPQNEPAYKATLKNNNTIRIGRSQNSHIRLTNQSISSKHAEIKYSEGQFILLGCNTFTGTWLRLSPKGVKSVDWKINKSDIFRISSKKTFMIEDLTEGIESETNKLHFLNV